MSCSSVASSIITTVRTVQNSTLKNALRASMATITGSAKIGDRVDADTLTALFKKEMDAIVLEGFLPPVVCRLASKRLLTGAIQDYVNAPGIGRVGISFFETTEPGMKDRYYKSALPNIRAIRKVFAPYAAPVDQVRVICDDVWPHGAGLSIHSDGKMFVGLCRRLESGKDILPHEDKFGRDDLTRAGKPLWGQLAFNVYLQPAESGGELQLWSLSLSTEEYDRMRGSSYGIAREALGPHKLTVTPGEGDLVIFNPTNLHAVGASTTPRLSISGFIGAEKRDSRLMLWS